MVKIKTKVVYEFTLDQGEGKTILQALRYVRHRIVEHGKIQAGNLEKIENIIKQMNHEL